MKLRHLTVSGRGRNGFRLLVIAGLPLILACGSGTGTPEPDSSLQAALRLAEAGVTRNADWIPFEQEIDGVTMVLVPVGCFIMGADESDPDMEPPEQPAHRQCVQDPFWLDKYEVTNRDYGSVSENCRDVSWEPEHPHLCLTWFAAVDYCAARTARLPTELEWEYAASGPDNLIFPWGNDFVAENAVADLTSGFQTAPVGSRPAGMSWIGALDLAGNAWEWVSSLSLPYPYEPEQAEDTSDTEWYRVLRGGSFAVVARLLRTAIRNSALPTEAYPAGGFRCARSIDDR